MSKVNIHEISAYNKIIIYKKLLMGNLYHKHTPGRILFIKKLLIHQILCQVKELGLEKEIPNEDTKLQNYYQVFSI